MIYQVGKKQCSNSGRKRNDIDPLESDFMVQPPSLLEFPRPLTSVVGVWKFSGTTQSKLRFCHFIIVPLVVLESEWYIYKGEVCK